MNSLNIFYLYDKLYDTLVLVFSGNYTGRAEGVFGWFVGNLALLQGIGFFITFSAIAGIVYAFLGINRIRQHEAEELGKLPEGVGEGASVLNERWQQVLQEVGTENPNDWRHAILEADIMLADLLTQLQYHGDTIGEQLKGIEESDFLTLDKAWEAHKVRNVIAHHGSDFVLTKREARRVIGLYEEVFREFGSV